MPSPIDNPYPSKKLRTILKGNEVLIWEPNQPNTVTVYRRDGRLSSIHHGSVEPGPSTLVQCMARIDELERSLAKAIDLMVEARDYIQGSVEDIMDADEPPRAIPGFLGSA